MTYKKFFLVLFTCLLMASFSACSGSHDQVSFVSLYSDEESNSDASWQTSLMPKLNNFELREGNELRLFLSGYVSKVNVYALRGNSQERINCSVELLQDDKAKSADSSNKAKRYEYAVKANADFKVGEKFIIEGSVESGANSVLDFSIPLEGFNSKPAKLLFSELRLGSTKKFGYIRFKVMEGGNLFGLKLLMPANRKAVEYSFPVAEVKKGENIVYHWFIPPDSDVVDELNNAKECGNKSAFADARDFWGRFKKFNPKRSNAILLRSSDGGALQDAVLFLHPKEDDWAKEEIAKAAKLAIKEGFWLLPENLEGSDKSENPDNAIRLNITPTKKIVRKNLYKLKHSPEDWKMLKDK